MAKKVGLHVVSFIARSVESLTLSNACGGDERAVFRRWVPMTEHLYGEMIASKHFTNGSDVDVVKNIYKRCFEACIVEVTSLNFSQQSWTDEDLVPLSLALVHCERLIVLVLDFNHITQDGVVDMLQRVRTQQQNALAHLQVLSIEGVQVRHIHGHGR
jgi:hypothetical protein